MDKRLKSTIDKFFHKNFNKKIKTPQIVFDLNILKDNYHLIKSSLANGKCEIRYAIKANNEERTIKVLKSLGSGFEIASLGELNILKNNFINPKKILFSSPVKIDSHIRAAYNYGIRYFAFDSFEELKKIAKNAPNSNVYLRIDVSNSGSIWKLDSKFGAPKKDWIKLLIEAKRKNLNPVGITFLVGWNNTNNSTWKKAVDEASQLIKNAIDSGIKIKFLNLGGGFPAHLVDQEKHLKQIVSTINPILNKLIKNYSVNIIAEPGTFLVANCGAMFTRVYAKLKRKSGNWLFIDSSIMGGFYEIFKDIKFNLYLPSKKNKLDFDVNYTITGPTCDSYDVFFKDIKLPKEVSVGELLVILPAGAYISSRREYNGFPYPETTYL
ncbi:alanine racemase [Candidatus Roizmanbacteria bacterium]|nr:alanine racemase [Candidatus Roizmanbacteria bacterium]